jgi:peptide methionine sulfoxide reductase msrA/msrB
MNRRLLLALCGALLVTLVGVWRGESVGGTKQERGQPIMSLRKLSDEERQVIVEKGTERPFTGKYVDHKGAGIYCCKHCGIGLYTSETKFDSGCGWPSFDDYIEGTVKMQPDPDGRRTEIVCARCGAHLGHVFYGEGFTPKDTRHCVNSISIDFVAYDDVETAVFGAGCFWGVEARFQRVPGVIATSVGYTGGDKPEPTYQQVCGGNTGHIETVKVEFNPVIVSYESLLDYFFEIHDPTQVRRQGPDVGYQYQSAIFYEGESQKQAAEDAIARLKQDGVDVATELLPASEFWMAEDYHQDYHRKKSR